jgi:hypothetical protein
MRDDLGTSPFLTKQAFEQVGIGYAPTGFRLPAARRARSLRQDKASSADGARAKMHIRKALRARILRHRRNADLR